ncbi:MAG: Acetolactate synthase large subunit [Pelotomaculum sp. PtaB.Bin013]|uniref:Acetolactate synthase n=1 Tax=Pelotomaculum isophthalicicum JI TaxID=947010 RepID=A0A9X4H862_9FIRM|nr:biosynthetic-type acetolactate synthase large subunit [Pelotomaculum isophthalicicum]MDF9408539.1 biosynthetic-type acetolactate synthase large subunit [Pelotomaculum isophthalicicum JI]OPX82373.1 MAG: Acetolactate synthase large subunit [Pelotomaculum sp. PtaB.Bin013]
MEITVAEALVRCLEQENVNLIFGYPGGAILPVYDALYNSTIKHVLTRHEQGAVHAADGYARVTGKVGVCLATSGPGATNLVTGIANAYMDSVPMVVITGQVPVSQIGTDAFQEVDITGITLPVTKHNFLIKDPKQLPQVVRKAFHIAATGRPGPVLIDLPKDVAQAKIKFAYPKNIHLPGYKPTYKGHPAMINQASKVIMESKRPVIYAGGGVRISNAAPELKELAETISAPVTHTLMGLGCFPGDHPLFLGMLGMHGTRYANQAVTECDCLITVGARFDDRVVANIEGFAPDAKIIHIDIDPAEISKNVQASLPIVGDVKQVLEKLLQLLKKRKNAEWTARVQALKKEYPLDYSMDGALKPQFVIEKLCESTGGDAVVVTDVGQHQMWTAQYYKFKEPRSFISSGGLGTMGFGLPAAIGAQMGASGQKVILITGDGSIQMTLQELGTAMEQELPLKIFVMNNRQLGMVRQQQEYYCEKRYIAVDFRFDLDFAALARVYGMAGYTVETAEQLVDILPEVLASPGPVMVNCLIGGKENVLPMVLAGSNINEAID